MSLTRCRWNFVEAFFCLIIFCFLPTIKLEVGSEQLRTRSGIEMYYFHSDNGRMGRLFRKPESCLSSSSDLKDCRHCWDEDTELVDPWDVMLSQDEIEPELFDHYKGSSIIDKRWIFYFISLTIGMFEFTFWNKNCTNHIEIGKLSMKWSLCLFLGITLSENFNSVDM